MTINTMLVLILGVFCYFFLPFIILSCFKNEKIKKIIAIILLSLFIVILLVGTWGKLEIGKDVVRINFDFSGKFCDKKINFSFNNLQPFDIIVNLIMMIPIGMFVVMLYNKNFVKMMFLLLIVGFLSGFFIEFTQFVLPIQRNVQLSDVIFNMISVIMGGLICRIYIAILNCVNNLKTN
ncbi:MAG: VanZ family protein [Candidatus Onthoplasma sp.]